MPLVRCAGSNATRDAIVERQMKTTRLVAAAMIAATVLVQAQAARTVQDGVFTDAQATRGQDVYAQRCATCHGAALDGAQGPPLTGTAFVAHWQSDPLSAL